MTIKTNQKDTITVLMRRENTGDRTGEICCTAICNTATGLVNNSGPAIIVHLCGLLAQS